MGITVSPSVNESTETSGPVKNSSITIFSPLLPKTLSSIISRTARFASGLNVGDHVQLQGRFQSRVYQKQLPDGTVQERTAYEVSVSRLTLESAAGAPLAEHDAPSRPGYSGALQ